MVKFLETCKDAKEEVKTIQRFWHPNVISMIDFVKWNNAYGIILRAMDMDLRHFMATELYDSVLVCDIARQCARGLHHVHEHQTLHADLKPENIGISIERKGGRVRIHIRLLDLGSAKLIVDVKTGVEIRSTLHYQSPEKRLGVFHLPGDIYELGVVYKEVSESSIDYSTSPLLYGDLVLDMLHPEFRLRPTSQQLLVRLEDPHLALWGRLRAVTDESVDITDLVQCEDPLSFLMRDLYARMEYIVRLTISDSVQQIEEAFFLLFKTAQNEAAADFDETQSVLQHIHHFHATVDTTWWTKRLYCMSLEALAELSCFGLTDIMKIKLWLFSSVPVCECHVRSILSRCMTPELFQWGSEHLWGQEQVQFARYTGVFHALTE